jgi:pSer/pThr/pTyr-binding forkhead associated (FHA) protein
LLWEAGERELDSDAESMVTESDAGPAGSVSPRPGNPLVVPLVSAQTESRLGGMSVGRSESNDVVIENPSVSRFHAVIHHDSRTQQWKVTDAGSRNGTHVDGVRIQREQSVVLKDGSAVVLGDAHLRFYLPKSFASFLASRVETQRK